MVQGESPPQSAKRKTGWDPKVSKDDKKVRQRTSLKGAKSLQVEYNASRPA
jgi:hypothetical protein